MKHDEYHRKFADAIIEQIKKGTAPWQKPWAPGDRVLPMNVDTDRSYRGGNSLHLASVQQETGYGDVRWGTYRQIKARGGQVRKGERGTRILSFQDKKRIAVTDERGRPRRNAEGKRIYRYEKLKAPFVRQYTVFNAEQADGLPERANPTPEPLWKAHQAAEKVMEDGGVPVRHVQGDRAYYHMKRDEIVLPERGQFPSANHYYQTALHELGHSTGHEDRMKRETLIEGIKNGFGWPDYAREELRAEISAMMTGERVGVGHDPARGAAYVEGWIQALEEDPREIRRAAADAQRISDFVLVRHIERTTEREPMAAAATRGPGARVHHLLPRTLRRGADRHRRPRRGLLPRPRRGPLRRALLYHPAGRQRLDRRRTRRRDHGHRPEGQTLQGPDPHPPGRGQGPGPRLRAGDGPPAGDRHLPNPVRPGRPRHRRLPRLRQGRGAAPPAGRHGAARPARRRTQGHRIAGELGLPVDDEGRVLHPDAQIEYEDAEGRTGRVNIEVASGNYSQETIKAKAAAGFAMHASGPAAAGMLRKLGLGQGDDGSWIGGPADRDPASVEL